MGRVPADVKLDDRGRFVVDANPPATHYERVTADATGIIGRPCAWFDQDEVAWEFGYRVASLPYLTDRGVLVVHVTTDVKWFEAALNGRVQAAEQWRVDADRVWLIAYGDRTPA